MCNFNAGQLHNKTNILIMQNKNEPEALGQCIPLPTAGDKMTS